MNDNKAKYKYTKVMTGRSWVNENKSTDSDPDMTGNMVSVRNLEKADGDYTQLKEEDKYAVSVWKNVDKKTGKAYISFAVSEKKSLSGGNDDELPF